MTRTWNGGRLVAPVVFFLWAIGMAMPAAGQQASTPRVWTAVSVQGRLGTSSPWRWTSDALVRTRDGAETLDSVAERIMLTRSLTKRSGAGLGYAYGAGFPDPGSLREHRFTQQYTWSSASGRASFRSRLEERFVSGNDMRFRVRQQARLAWPLAVGGGVHAVVSGELFVQINATAQAARGVEAGRTFVGIRRTLTARSGMEIGYLNVYSRGAGGRHRSTHVMSATLMVSL